MTLFKTLKYYKAKEGHLFMEKYMESKIPSLEFYLHRRVFFKLNFDDTNLDILYFIDEEIEKFNINEIFI